MVDQPSNDFDPNEHGEDASSAAYDAEREQQDRIRLDYEAGFIPDPEEQAQIMKDRAKP